MVAEDAGAAKESEEVESNQASNAKDVLQANPAHDFANRNVSSERWSEDGSAAAAHLPKKESQHFEKSQARSEEPFPKSDQSVKEESVESNPLSQATIAAPKGVNRPALLAKAALVVIAGSILIGLSVARSSTPVATANKVNPLDSKLAQLNLAIEHAGNNPQPYLQRAGLYYFDREEPANALGDLDKAIELDPDLTEAYVLRAEVCSYLHYFDRADADVQKAITLKPKWPGVYAERASVERMREDYNKSIEDCQKAFALEADNYQALGELACAYDDMGRHQEAIDCTTKQIKMTQPRPYPRDYLSRATERFHNQDFDGTISDTNAALKIDPKMGTAKIVRAYAEAAKGEISKAESDAAQGLMEETVPSRGHRLVADLYRFLGNFDRAIEEYGKAISLHNLSIRSYRDRGISYYRLGQLANAVQDLEHSVKMNPASITLSYLALVEEDSGKGADADRHIAAALAAPSPTSAVYSNRAAIMLKRGKYSEALADAKKAMDMDKYNADAYQVIGSLYKAQGKLQDSKPYFEKAQQYKYPGSVPQLGW